MSNLSARRLLLCSAIGLCLSPAMAVAQGCQNGGGGATTGAASTFSGQSSTAQPALLSQLGSFQNLMMMQRNLQVQQQQPIQISPQQMQMQRQMLMPRIRQQQQQQESSSTETTPAATAREVRQVTLSAEDEEKLKGMSRLERKKFAIRERRRLRELAKAEE